jgi:hypothetical protein
MRRALFPATLLWLAACGSDGVSGAPLFDGFQPQGGAAVIFASTVCDIPFVGTSAVAGVAILLSDHADLCPLIEQTKLCGTKAGSTALLGVAISGQVGAASVEPAGPGTYRYMSEPPTGSFMVASADAARVDDSCKAGDGGDRDARGGSITIDAITADRVSGRIDIGFDYDEAFQQPFDVATCAVTIDLCDKLTGCFSRTCVP